MAYPTYALSEIFEGICLSRTIATEKQLVPNVVAASSPVVYAHDEAWHRLKYYVVVNHLGHLVSTIGKATRNEVVLWQLVAHRLMTWKKNTRITQYLLTV